MGKLMRRYWMPVCLGSDLVAGGAPKRVRMLGEDLVAFRSPDGSIGLVDEACPHRAVSLALARNEECGLRCLYHGWVMNAQGRVVETPAEPDGSRLKERVSFKPTLFASLAFSCSPTWGRPNCSRRRWILSFPIFPSSHVLVMRFAKSAIGRNASKACSTRAFELSSFGRHQAEGRGLAGTEDTDLKLAQFARPSKDGAPRLEVEAEPYGFRYAALRARSRTRI